MSAKDKESLKKRILEDEDFIYCPRLGNSLGRLIDKNPSGVENDRIEKVLLMSQEEVDKWYYSAIEKLRRALKVK